MPPIPTITSNTLVNKLIEAIGVTVASELAIEHFGPTLDRVWADFGPKHGVLDSLLLPDPETTWQQLLNEAEPFPQVLDTNEVIINPVAHFTRLQLVDPSVVERIIAEMPEGNDKARSVWETVRQNGGALVQQIANASNADKTVARLFRAWLNGAIEKKAGIVEAIGQSAEDRAADSIKGWISGLAEFIIGGSFARPRKSGDAKRVSKEFHEYKHLTSPIKTYGRNSVPLSVNSFPSHVEVMLYLFDFYKTKGLEGEDAPALVPGVNFNEFPEIALWYNSEEVSDKIKPSEFSYGVFADCNFCRKFLAELKIIVQSCNAANIKSFANSKGQDVEDFVWEKLRNINMSRSHITSAVPELVNVVNGNRALPVEHYNTTEYLQPSDVS